MDGRYRWTSYEYIVRESHVISLFSKSNHFLQSTFINHIYFQFILNKYLYARIFGRFISNI